MLTWDGVRRYKSQLFRPTGSDRRSMRRDLKFFPPWNGIPIDCPSTWDKMLADAMTVRLTLRPESLDTIVATNLHADILSDLAGALAGSLSVVLTANIDPERCFLQCSNLLIRSAARSLDRESPTGCDILDRLPDARSSRRNRRSFAPDERHRVRLRRRNRDAGRRRERDDADGHRCGY